MAIITGINGFGRFGLHLLKYWLDRSSQSHYRIGYINDDFLRLEDALDIIHLDRHVKIPRFYKISVNNDQIIFTSANGTKNYITYTHQEKNKIPWLGEPEIFLDCSGKNTSSRDCKPFLVGNTKKVLISATSWDADQTLIFGFNHKRHNPSAQVISYGSCTVNGYVPLAAFLHKKWGIVNSDVNVIHNIQEYKLKDPKNHTLLRKFCTLEKSGADLLKFLNTENFIVNYTVIPYSGVSTIDFRFELKQHQDLESILNILQESLVSGELRHLYGMDETDRGPEVHKCSPHSAIFIREKARLLGNNFYLPSYFDNENSVNRFHDLTEYLAKT